MRRFEVDNPEECVYRVSEILNVLSDGQLMRDTLGSVLSGSNIARNLPDFEAVLEGFPKLLELFPGLKKRCVVYAPEARLNALRYDLNEGMESKVSGLYIVGDMSGHTNSFVQAACSGLIASFHILEKYGV